MFAFNTSKAADLTCGTLSVERKCYKMFFLAVSSNPLVEAGSAHLALLWWSITLAALYLGLILNAPGICLNLHPGSIFSLSHCFWPCALKQTAAPLALSLPDQRSQRRTVFWYSLHARFSALWKGRALRNLEAYVYFAEGSYDVMELDAMEILAEHTHFCEICNKGGHAPRKTSVSDHLG